MSRSTEIDIVKGLGILFVVAGHVISGIATKIIFLFHMPLFFIVSGYLHKSNSNEFEYLKRKAISLLIPYYTYLFIFQLPNCWNILCQINSDPTTHTVTLFLKHIIRLLWGGRLLTDTLGVFWFVTCLFHTQQLYNYVSNRFKKKIKLLFLAIILYIVSFANQYAFEWYPFPLGINIVLCSFLFYVIGNYFGDFIFGHKATVINLSSLISCTIPITLICYNYKLSFNMKYTYYGWFFVSPIAAVLITKNISFLSYKLKNIKILRVFFAFAGKASITIMFMHQFLHYRLKSYCDKYPYTLTFIIFIVCILLHYIVSLNSISKSLLLGSRDDLK